MKIGIIQYPGSNDYKNFFCTLLNQENVELIPIWYQESIIPDGVELVIIPGGSSFGNLIRPGAIASRMSIINAIIDFTKKGYYALGIDNGFHILCEAKLLPGTFFMNNNSSIFAGKVKLKSVNNTSIFTGSYLPDQTIIMTISNLYSRYYVDEALLERLYDHQQISMLYCDDNLNVNNISNITNSTANIASILNKDQNIMGILPHPERSLFCKKNQQSGKSLFDGLLNCLTI